jgi:hypothetical protein
MSATPITDFMRAFIKVIRLVVIKMVDVCVRMYGSVTLIPIGYMLDYFISNLVMVLKDTYYASSNTEWSREVTYRMENVMATTFRIKERVTLALDSVIQPTRAITQRIRTLSNVELECVWLNQVVRFSWLAGLCPALEHSTEEYIRSLLETHTVLRSVQLTHISLGRVAPLIKSLKVHENESGAQELTTEIECSWASDEGEILFNFTDISGNRRFLRLHHFQLAGLSRCTFDSATSAFFPWGAVSCQFYQRPSVRFRHESFLDSPDSDAGAAAAPVTSMVVDAIVSLLKSKLKDVALAPRSVRFNLSSSSSRTNRRQHLSGAA